MKQMKQNETKWNKWNKMKQDCGEDHQNTVGNIPPTHLIRYQIRACPDTAKITPYPGMSITDNIVYTTNPF
jgi:hypothetical protein